MERTQRKRKYLTEMLLDLPAADTWNGIVAAQVMTPSPICVRTETTARELVSLLHSNRFRHFIVTDAEGTLKGIVSDRDVLRLFGLDPGSELARERIDETTAGTLMSPDVIEVFPWTPIVQVVRTLLRYGISCVPVVEAGRPVGIVTSTDLYLILELLLVGPKAVKAEYSQMAQRLGTLGDLARANLECTPEATAP
jgi:acetoin utilization protein AcuB